MSTKTLLAKDLMRTQVLTVRPDTDFNAVELLSEWKHVRHVPVVDEHGALRGMVSIRDLLAHLTGSTGSRFVPISTLMSENVVSAGPEDSAAQVAKKMIANEVGAVPIVDEGRVVGIISERDFVSAFIGLVKD